MSENSLHKEKLLSKLSELEKQNLLIGFCINQSLTEYIFHSKLYRLFNLSFDFLGKYNNTELLRLHKIIEYVGIDNTIKICSKAKINNITKYNANLLLLYINNIENFISKKIAINWGPGNYGRYEKNIDEHYKKHILSDEGMYWSNILSELNCEYYKKYAIDSFYKMKNVIVHSNGKNVYLSGFYGNVFIVGRYDNNQTFGISSCYYVINGEKKGREKDFCFYIDWANT